MATIKGTVKKLLALTDSSEGLRHMIRYGKH